MSATPDAARDRLRAVLRRVPYFRQQPADVQAALLDAARHRSYDAGQIIYLAGDPVTHVFLLERGWVKASRMTRAGREQGLLFLRPVDVFGHIGLFTDGTYPGTTTALERADVWAIPGELILRLVAEHPAFALGLIRELSDRIRYYIALAEDLGLRSVDARLAHNLLRNAVVTDGQLVVPRRGWTTFDEMAVRLGTVRDVLSRSLKKLEADGLIRVERGAVVVLDPAGLADRCDG